MGKAEPILLAWSGGKDSALTLHELQKTDGYDAVALLTTVTEEYDRVSMHGVRRTLLEQQARAVGLPLEIVFIAPDAPLEEYGTKMRETLSRYKDEGIEWVAFGDLFLEDVRKYREENLEKVGMKGLFPLWGRDTAELACEFIAGGFKAVVTCVDSRMLDKNFVGREFDVQFLADLPTTADPCGEHGEFHSFVYAGPIFRHPISHEMGDVVLRDNRFWYCDVKPIETRVHH